MAKVTKTDKVKDYLENHPGGITSLQAINLFGATRLSDIIYRLKKDGMKISTTIVPVKDRYGSTCHVALYKLEG